MKEDNEINGLIERLINMNMWTFSVGVLCGIGIMIAVVLLAKGLGLLVW
jgi:hypothetical protein